MWSPNLEQLFRIRHLVVSKFLLIVFLRPYYFKIIELDYKILSYGALFNNILYIINKVLIYSLFILQRDFYAMETATILSIFILGLLLGITGYSVYTAFGPVAKELRDPFEEHED